MSTSFTTQTEALLAELSSTRRRTLPFAALGVLATLVALAIMLWLLAENRRQAAEIERQTQVAQKSIAQLNATLAQLKAGGQSSRLVQQAIGQATAAKVALSEVQTTALDPGETAGVTVPPAEVTLGPQLIARGPDSGWDVDLFWCAGPGEAGNYAAARQAGILLGIEAARGRAIAPGVRVGRVRLRTVREQGRANWPAGFYAVSDGGDGEDAAANAAATFLTSKQLAVGRKQSQGKPTASYFSIFACN
ncbi:hypothetical protein RZN05_10020 [Sphingomonas sp. HF-S4]|uniref:Uncharacterized protein n=1 Tax=Sphingomonas agrestis TaxID=3080540 RepID=A0ABU3Y7B7_9SPHN|nr:hypothetical protein [Sphingomonas sp. HF-S4]MDV3457318.1 hypothetical protein [Sphingomonas sp. HF-S4]